MRGSVKVQVSNRKVRYRFELHRNITIVRGDSGTGKTTLYDMIAEYTRMKEASGVNLSSTSPCVALVDMNWKYQLSQIQESVVFIDEGADYVGSEEFAKSIQETDNYFVIFNRENLHMLPYSVDEVYEIKTSNRYHSFKRIYTRDSGFLYSSPGKNATIILTEDSRAGFQLYQHLYKGTSIICKTAYTNAGIYYWLQEHHQEGIFVIADGAAFGAEMDRVMKLQKQYPDNISICLPESFEWLILQSGIVPISGLQDMLNNPGSQIESADYFSWERFFTDYLVQHSAGTYYAYSKSRLHRYYTLQDNAKKVVALIAENMPTAEVLNI